MLESSGTLSPRPEERSSRKDMQKNFLSRAFLRYATKQTDIAIPHAKLVHVVFYIMRTRQEFLCISLRGLRTQAYDVAARRRDNSRR